MLDSENVASPAGYDAAVEVRELDDYQRWPVAMAISNVIDTAPREWSTRIGLYGQWGDGKTTVLNFLQTQQERKGNIVIRYSPWGASTEATVWKELGAKLKAGLKKEGISLGLKTVLIQQIKRCQGWWSAFFKVGAKAVDVHIGIPMASTVVDASSGIINKLLGFTKKDIEDLSSAFGNRRVVVFIDDLDRTDPSIVPRLLLALRELLDIPRFVFVLAFDKTVVCPALADYNPAWGKSGEAFLEKIIDFPFDLVAPEHKHIGKLAHRYFDPLSDFFDIGVIDEIIPLLPVNPRRLKLLSRVIASLGPEARRHDKGELDWSTIIIFQMLRLESDRFTREIIANIFDNQKFSWMRYALSNEERTEEEEARFNELINRSFSEQEEERRERVHLLVNAWRKHRSFHAGELFRYYISFGDRPHHVTWGEFKKLLFEWRTDRDSSQLRIFAQKRADHLASTTDEVAIELLDTAVQFYGATIERLTTTRTTEKFATLIEEANDTLDMVQYLTQYGMQEVAISNFQRPDVFIHFLHIATTWIHFTMNPGEPDLREREITILTEWCETWPDKVVLFGKLKPWAEDDSAIDATASRLRKELIGQLTSILWPFIIAEVITFFEKQDGVKNMVLPDANEPMRFVLESPKSELYKPEYIAQLSTLLHRAPDSIDIFENSVIYLKLLIDALDHRGRYCVRDERITFLTQHKDFIAVVWSAATANRHQYRFLESLREMHKSLIDAGMKDDSLPLQEWLEIEQAASESD